MAIEIKLSGGYTDGVLRATAEALEDGQLFVGGEVHYPMTVEQADIFKSYCDGYISKHKLTGLTRDQAQDFMEGFTAHLFKLGRAANKAKKK